ncbi:MAG: RHS repeat-associated core domain-containing protein [Marinagarivorans sp.]|nr:RHS repeat-associated core domain-containing protein [Marinagarivorans sp.]
MINADASIDFKRTIGGVAQVTHRVASNGALGAGDYKYLHKDHLGSITAITYGGGTQKGQVFQRMAFDPWGARREISNNKVSAKLLPQTSVLATFAKTAKPITNRGFTGHEMLDEVGIIHMNGRIYDATIGRFLQADPTIDGATSVGGFNRYAYVKNNPLNAVDPTGYSWISKAWKKLKPFISIIVGAVLVAVTGGAASFFVTQFWGAVLLGGITGAVGAAANGGNLRDVLKGAAFGAVSGAAFFGAGAAFRAGGALKGLTGAAKAMAQIGVHGAVGGVMSVLQGGKFGNGFVSAGIGKGFTLGGAAMGLGDVGNFALTTLAGGTASVATGGKFANGAQTAALAFLVNHVATKGIEAQKGYSSDKGGWHDYTTTNEVCSAALQCTQQEMVDQFSRFAVPGQDPSKPVQSGNIYDVFDPRTKVSLPGGYQWQAFAGKVLTLVSGDGMSITNITRPLHILHDGQITRTLSTEGGAWFVTTRGIGNNVLPGGASMNQWQGPKIFNFVDAQMSANIEAHR